MVVSREGRGQELEQRCLLVQARVLLVSESWLVPVVNSVVVPHVKVGL